MQKEQGLFVLKPEWSNISWWTISPLGYHPQKKMFLFIFVYKFVYPKLVILLPSLKAVTFLSCLIPGYVFKPGIKHNQCVIYVQIVILIC